MTIPIQLETQQYDDAFYDDLVFKLLIDMLDKIKDKGYDIHKSAGQNILTYYGKVITKGNTKIFNYLYHQKGLKKNNKYL